MDNLKEKMDILDDLELMTSTMEEVMRLSKQDQKRVLSASDPKLLARMCALRGWDTEEVKASLDDKQREEFSKSLDDIRMYEAINGLVQHHVDRIRDAAKILDLKNKIIDMYDDEHTRAEDLYQNIAYSDGSGYATDEAAMYADEVASRRLPVSGNLDEDKKTIYKWLLAAKGIMIALERYADDHSGRSLFTPAIKELRALASGDWEGTALASLRGGKIYNFLLSDTEYTDSECKTMRLIERIEDYFSIIDARKAGERGEGSQLAANTPQQPETR